MDENKLLIEQLEWFRKQTEISIKAKIITGLLNE